MSKNIQELSICNDLMDKRFFSDSRHLFFESCSVDAEQTPPFSDFSSFYKCLKKIVRDVWSSDKSFRTFVLIFCSIKAFSTSCRITDSCLSLGLLSILKRESFEPSLNSFDVNKTITKGLLDIPWNVCSRAT